MIAIDSLTTRVHKEVSGIERLVPEWSRLWEQCRAATTFQRPEWVVSWMRVFKPTEAVFVEVRQNDGLVGIAPFLIYEDGSQRILGLMGGGISDYLDVLIAPDVLDQVLCALMCCIARPEFAWDVMNLTDLSASSPLLELGTDSGWGLGAFGLEPHDVCTQICLPADTQRIQQVIPKRKYSNLRNARSRFRNAGKGRIEVAKPETLEEFLEALFHLHSLRWEERDEPGVLAAPSIQAFHREVAPRLLKQGVLRLYGARLDGRIIAALYSLFERESVLCYMQGFDPAYKALGAGTLLLGAAIEDAISQGKKRVDLLRGRESYKSNWGVKENPTFRLGTRKEALALNLLREHVAA